MSTGNHTPLHILAVCALVTSPDGRVLMVRHPRRGWEVPGGQVEEGESLLGALQREILEESGVIIRPGKLTGVYNNLAPPPKLILGFLGSWVSGELTTSEESVECEWVRRDQVLARVTHPILFDRIRDMLEYSGRTLYRIYTSSPYILLEKGYL